MDKSLYRVSQGKLYTFELGKLHQLFEFKLTAVAEEQYESAAKIG